MKQTNERANEWMCKKMYVLSLFMSPVLNGIKMQKICENSMKKRTLEIYSFVYNWVQAPTLDADCRFVVFFLLVMN